MLSLRSFFDNTFYLQNNPDVGLALANGKVSSAFDHFNRFGKFEDRDPNALFDTSYYLQTNTDVAAAVEQNKTTAVDHFIRSGQFERRNPNFLFDTAFYRSNNPDVTAAVQQNQLTFAEHYLKLGQFENRKPSLSFDPNYYVQKYPLVETAISSGVVKSAFEHYVRFGLEETRASAPPDPTENLNLAESLGVLAGTLGVSDFVGNTEPVDIYSFILNAPSRLSVTLDGLSADADLVLIQDVNRNGVIGIDGLVGSSTNFGTASEQILDSGPLAAGLYFVRVSQFQGDTNHNLTLASAPIVSPSI